MTLVPASSHGGITTPLEVDAAVEGGLIIDQGAAAASTAVVSVNDALGNNAFSVTPAGVVTIFSDGARQEATLNMSDNTSGNPGVVTLDTYTGLLMNIEASSQTLVRLSPRTGHTGRQLVALNAGGVTELLAISVGGYLLIKTHAAPADGDLAAGEVAEWFEQTSGAAALGLKGKDAGGTVRTSAYPLRQGSGALSTVAPASGTAFQCSVTQDVFLTVPVTYNPGVATTATCKVELSPDNSTFSELVTITQPVGTVFDGSIEAVQLIVPAAWRVKLTVVNATLGTGTYC